jgi:uncharacterized protein (DUF1800 family)
MSACALVFAVAAAHAEPTGTAVEFYNTNLRHYFVTANPAEAGFVDSGGAGAGWVRTGGEFSVYANAGDAADVVPVCRFYGTPGVGPNSHFYTADANECALVKTMAGWSYEGIAFHIHPARNGTCAAGTTPVYRSYNNGAARNDSNHRFTVDLTVWAKVASIGHVPEAVVMCAPLSSAELDADALRLLRQATFGPREADVARVRALGPSAWIDEQIAIAPTRYPDYPYVAATRPATCVDTRVTPVQPDSYCARDNYTLFPLQRQFFVNALGAPDQLRQRVAFAYSQIFVVSGIDNSRNYAMRHYQQIFLDRAFGNFEEILAAVTLSPVMGDYLDMANNNKSNPATGAEPNENYAREILQLFSIGVYKLNQDGTLILDAKGKPVPTYDQDEIEGFAHVFTGWTYPTIPGALARGNNPRSYLGPMEPAPQNHDTGAKTLLDGAVNPAGLAMRDDLARALHNIFMHPNVGPFIGRQLIQKLVTSDPTPGYVSRVAAAFNDNGARVRGDMGAVVRAVLLDPEARGARKIDPGYGKLAEPVLWVAQVARAFNASSDGVYFRGVTGALGQPLFYAPTVFNYYPPDYVLPGTQLNGPEFALQTATTAINRANVANTLLFSNTIAPDATVYGATGTTLNFGALTPYAGNAIDLVARMARLLVAGNLSSEARSAIVTAVNAIATSDATGRVRAAAYLITTSSQYQVER